MRAPFQILAIPYKYQNGKLLYCVLHRSDVDQWQFVSGGGEDAETPLEAAKREIYEESGIVAKNIISLKSICSIPADYFKNNWPDDIYVVPEYSFGFECNDDIVLSCEHTEFVWTTYEDATVKLKWDSNKTALYELNCRLKKMN